MLKKIALIMALCALPAFATTPTTQPGDDAESLRQRIAQLDNESAALHAKLAATTQPAAKAASAPTTRPAESVVAMASRLSRDLDDVLAKSPDAKQPTIDACFSGIHGEAGNFTGSIFTVTDGAPIGPQGRVIVVRLTLPRAETVDLPWRQRISAMNKRFDEKDLRERTHFDNQTRNQQNVSEESHRRAMEWSANERAKQIRALVDERPPAPIVDIYLTASENFIASSKTGQVIKGKITFVDGRIVREQQGKRNGTLTYAAKIELTGQFLPD